MVSSDGPWQSKSPDFILQILDFVLDQVLSIFENSHDENSDQEDHSPKLHSIVSSDCPWHSKSPAFISQFLVLVLNHVSFNFDNSHDKKSDQDDHSPYT